MTTTRSRMRLAGLALAGFVLVLLPRPAVTQSLAPTGKDAPNVLLLTIDTLRADRVSSYGYERQTTPNIDRLIDGGIRFERARTVEPLTTPALCSMLTSLFPHDHGATRNGLRLRSGLASLPKALQAQGYRTAAFVGNWTLRNKLSRLAEHFEQYEEILTRRRWLGLVRSEATADDITAASLEWIESHARRAGADPFLVWVHYVEPHAPYRLHKEHADALGLDTRGNVGASDRYDTEIAYVDASVGRLLSGLERLGIDDDTLVVFTSDHGESLGEHKYWGHGRQLYEPTLRIPMSIYWPGRLQPQTIQAPALNIDLAPTVLSLLGHVVPSTFRGFDWSRVLDGADAPTGRVTGYQAHRGAVIARHDSDLARSAGLLEVGLVRDERKEIYRIRRQRRSLFDLESDPLENNSLGGMKETPTEGLLDWMQSVSNGLNRLDETLPLVEALDEESVEQLRALGYIE